MIKPQSIRKIENKRFNKEFSTFPDLNSLKQFCKDEGANSNMRCDSFKSLMIINKLSKLL
ncbi:hypothetical protein [Acinetobacter indicus]|uniref:hypothetical protein n=1 Tax=Acinetobacter indicus TaxID=756892 RepID=UPI00396A00F9